MAVPPASRNAQYLNPELDLLERTKLAIKALREQENDSERQRLAIAFDQDLMEKVVFLHPEFNGLVANADLELSPQQRNPNQSPKAAANDIPASVIPLTPPNPTVETIQQYSTPIQEPKPVLFKTEKSFEDLKQQLVEQKYENFKLTEHESGENLDYSFKNRDCQYSGNVNKQGAGKITVENTGVWTQKDVDDLIDHVCNDIGSKSVNIHEDTITPQSMLLKACEALEERGVKVKITNGTAIKSTNDIKTEIDEHQKSNPESDKFSDFPNELQEKMKAFDIKILAIHKKLEPLISRYRSLDKTDLNNKEELDALFAKINPLHDESEEQANQYIVLLQVWLAENPDHPTADNVIRKIEKIEQAHETKAKKGQEIEIEYKAKQDAVNEKINEINQKQAFDFGEQGESLLTMTEPDDPIHEVLSITQIEDLRFLGQSFKEASQKLISSPDDYVAHYEVLAVNLNKFITSPSFEELKKIAPILKRMMEDVKKMHEGINHNVVAAKRSFQQAASL